MKKAILIGLVLFAIIGQFALADDNEFQVNVAIEAPRPTRNLETDLITKAKVEALKKYLLRLDSNMGQDFIRKATAEVEKFVEDDGVEKKSTKWENLTKDMGQLQGSFVVELKIDEINQWLKENGFKTQGKFELVIMEEPPSVGSMKLNEEAGTKSGEGKFFIQNYTSFQRRVRDYLIKKMDEFGFDVLLLQDNDDYDKYKNKDNELVGVFFDADTDNFAINKELLRDVQDNNPDTFVLYYRLESIEYERAKNQISVTVALSIKNLDTNITKAFGTADFAYITNSTTPGKLVDDIGFVAEKAILKLLSAEGAASRLNRLVMEMNNAAKQPTGPIKVTINAKVIDPKIRKKVMYQLKKQIVEKGIVANASSVKSTNNSMTFEAKPDYKDSEELYMEHLSPIFEELGVELQDDMVSYKKGSIIIKPDTKTDEE